MVIAMLGGIGVTFQSAVARQLGPGGGAQALIGEARYIPREILVFPHDPGRSPEVAGLMLSHGFLILARAPMSGMILAAAPLEGLEAYACQWLRTWPEVRAAERNRMGRVFQPDCPFTGHTPDPCTVYPSLQAACQSGMNYPAGIPNDPAFCFQWGLKNVGQEVVDRSCSSGCWQQTGVPGVDVRIMEAWQRTTGSPLVTVAILDSGIEYCNPDFDPNRFFYPDIALTCVGNDGPTYPCCYIEPCVYGNAGDNYGHGTIVASILGAVAGNGIGIAGIDQQCRILSARIVSENEALQHFIAANIGRTIVTLERIATDSIYESVRVINMSYGFPCSDEEMEEEANQFVVLGTAISTLVAQDRFVVAAAGNFGFGKADEYCPTRLGGVITVGGIDSRGWRYADPNCTGSSSSTGLSLDFVAPGMAHVGLICQSNPCSSCPYTTYSCDPYGFYARNYLSGTSYAAPMVCGAISRIFARGIELEILDPGTWEGLT